MRRISIEEVGPQLEHVLLMPTETLHNLIIMFVIGGSTFPAIIHGCYPMVALTTDTLLSMFSGVS